MIRIKQTNTGFFVVFDGDKSSGQLTYDEMLGLVAQLTMPESRPCLQWMKSPEQWKAHGERRRSLRDAQRDGAVW